MNKDYEDYWSNDEFEDTVAAALIACYETKVRKNKGAPPADRMTNESFQLIRNVGPYIPSNSRLYIGTKDIESCSFFDTENDILPEKGCFSFIPKFKVKEHNPNSYFTMVYFQKVQSLGKYWIRPAHGTLYMAYIVQAETTGITGDRRYVVVTPDGRVFSCTQQLVQFDKYGKKRDVINTPPTEVCETAFSISIALQAIADKKFCWTITGQERNVKVNLGCMQEEIKSLLYARSLPLTATGRKRPILHLIESHKRRIKNGIDIDITAYLRGQQTVEIDGTIFTINPPQVLKDRVSENSKCLF